MVQKSIWDKKGVLDNVTFADLLSDDFKETESLSDWFNAYNNADNSYQPELLVGLGAYQVTEWVASQYITIEKKENWWGKNDSSVYSKAYPDKIIFKICNKLNKRTYRSIFITASICCLFHPTFYRNFTVSIFCIFDQMF